MPDTDDLYEILQVHHAAEPEVVEAAYRRLARKYHPDVNKSDQAEGMMKALNRAYEVLSDPVKRAAYDRERGGQSQGAAGETPGRSQAWNEAKRDGDFFHIPYEEQVNQLFWAAHYGNTEIVLTLISLGVDVNVQDDEGLTPLHVATIEGHLQTAQVLVMADARIDIKDNNGYTPLYIAAITDNLRIVQMLAAHGADVNAKDKNGFTPLHAAAFDGNTEVVRELIRLGANVNARARGYTPLDVASVEGHDSTISVLLAAGAETGNQRGRRRGIAAAGLVGAAVLGTLASLFLGNE